MPYRYDDPRAKSRKSRVYRAFRAGGVDKARAVGRECGIQSNTLATWLSLFKNNHTSSRAARKKRGPSARSGLRIMQLAYRRGGLKMARDVGTAIKLRPTTIANYAKLIEAVSD